MGGGTLKLNIVDKVTDGDSTTYTYDHTWQEVHDAFEGGTNVIYQTVEDYNGDANLQVRYLRVLDVVTGELGGMTVWGVIGEKLNDGAIHSLIVDAVARADSADSPIKTARGR